MKFQLYSKNEIKERPKRRLVTVESYVIGNNAPSVLICPGGAYKFVSDSNEGRPFAEKLNERGYNAFVLFYSVGSGNARYPYPMEDVARAIQFIKSRSDEFNTDPNGFALMGSSAGGHLCSFFATQYERFEGEYEGKTYSLKPKALVLAYPVITMGELTHNKDDKSVSYKNSVMLEQALNEKSVKNEFIYYNTGGHGIGLAEGKEAEGWADRAIDFLDSVF